MGVSEFGNQQSVKEVIYRASKSRFNKLFDDCNAIPLHIVRAARPNLCPGLH